LHRDGVQQVLPVEGASQSVDQRHVVDVALVGGNALNAASVLAWTGSYGTSKVRTTLRTGFAGLHPERAKGYPEIGHPCGKDVN
jgi:hypothetical protein